MFEVLSNPIGLALHASQVPQWPLFARLAHRRFCGLIHLMLFAPQVSSSRTQLRCASSPSGSLSGVTANVLWHTTPRPQRLLRAPAPTCVK